MSQSITCNFHSRDPSLSGSMSCRPPDDDFERLPWEERDRRVEITRAAQPTIVIKRHLIQKNTLFCEGCNNLGGKYFCAQCQKKYQAWEKED